jgi:hypothetical protein
MGQKPILVFVLAVLLVLGITVRKVYPYHGNFSVLIGIWEGFYLLNPGYFPENFVVHSDGGYDGQFFYLVARYLYDPSFSYPPILDAFELRFSRIGLSLLSGFFSFFSGFSFYPYITFVILWVTHFLASYLIYNQYKDTEYNFYYIFFLYSPFAWNSNLLLVSDSLFASTFVFIVLSFKKIGLNFFSSNAESYRILKKEFYIPLFFLTCFFLSIRETSLPIIGTFLLFAIWKFHFPSIWILTLSLFVYGGFKTIIKFKMFYFLGTNPLGFMELIDYPLLGFIKSFGMIQNITAKTIIREIGKLAVFSLFITQILSLKNILSEINKLKYLPLLFFSLLMVFAEVGYWLTFDNISRFFTISVPFMIFLRTEKKDFQSYGFFSFILILFLLFFARMLFLSR